MLDRTYSKDSLHNPGRRSLQLFNIICDLYNGYRGPFPAVKRPGRGADHASTSGPGIECGYGHICTVPLCLLATYWGSLYLYLFINYVEHFMIYLCNSSFMILNTADCIMYGSTSLTVKAAQLPITFYPLAVTLGTTRFNIQKFYMALALR